MRRWSAGSEFRFDPSIAPGRRLGGRDVFLELETTAEIGAAADEAIESSLGRLLMHLPPNPWSPLMQSSFRELGAHPDATWPGRVTVPIEAPLEPAVGWRLHSVTRGAAGSSAGLRAGAIIELPDRAAALRSHQRIAELLAKRPIPPWQGSVRVPAEVTPRAVSVRPLRLLDALEQVQLADPDDPEDESYTIGRQRHSYDGIPTLIELWGSGDYMGRAWIMLSEDVVARFGTLDLDAVQRLVTPDMRAGAKVLVRDQGDHVLVNEI